MNWEDMEPAYIKRELEKLIKPLEEGGTVRYPGTEEPGLPPGRIMADNEGRFFCACKTFEGGNLYGRYPVRTFADIKLEVFSDILDKPELAAHDIERVLFLDIETTFFPGGGYGPFMIGLGYFKGDTFHTDVLFMRGYGEERSMLRYLPTALDPFGIVVTYNGINFDIPHIERRMAFHGMNSPFADMDHLDALYPARRIWSKRFRSCGLKNLEHKLLGLERLDDIPGRYIPGRYKDYAASGYSSLMGPVFDHNILDVVSLAGVTWILGEALEGKSDRPSELTALAEIYKQAGKKDRALSLFKRALEFDMPEALRTRTMINLSRIYRQRKKYDLALPLWKTMAGNKVPHSFPYIELAKYYEKVEKDFTRALEWAEKTPTPPGKTTKEHNDKRIKRLKGKIEKVREQESADHRRE